MKWIKTKEFFVNSAFVEAIGITLDVKDRATTYAIVLKTCSGAIYTYEEFKEKEKAFEQLHKLLEEVGHEVFCGNS